MSTTMPTQAFIDLFSKIKNDQNAHKIISLLHLMLHMDGERLDGGEQAPPAVCVQTEALLEQMATVKKLNGRVDHQKIILRQLEQKNKDMNAQLRELIKRYNKYLLISEMNKRLYVKSKRLEGAYEELCHQNQAAKEEMKEQRSLILDLQQRLGGLEATKKQKDEFLASEEVKEKDAFRREVGELCLQIKMAKDEMKEQKSLILNLQQRLDRLEAARQKKDASSQPQEAQKKSSTKAGKEEEKGKQSKMASKASGKRAAEAERKPEVRNTNCKDKVAACRRTGVTAKLVCGDNSTRKPRNAPAAKGQSEKPGTEKKAAADRRKPRITSDSRPNLRDAKPAKAPPPLEKKDSKLPPINKDRTAPFHRARLKENLLPGRFASNRSGTSVAIAVQTSQDMSLRTPVQVLQDSARTRIPKLPLLGTKTLVPHHNSHKFTGGKAPLEVGSAAPESLEERSPLFPVTNIDFQRDEDFSPWEHERVVQSSNEDGEDNE